MAEDIYTQLGIDKSKLKRDYITDPLKKVKSGFIIKIEKPYKEDLKYMYIDKNLILNDLSLIFNTSISCISTWIIDMNLSKDKKIIYDNIQKRVCETNNKKYGCSCSLGSSFVRNKALKTIKEKYGVDNVFQSNIVKEKIKQVIKEKYNVDHPMRCKEIVNKVITNSLNTKRKKHTFNTSEPEEYIYNLLCSKYKEVKRQYKTELYPFACDFYIPKIDTYIEYQGYWMHGFEPYIGSKEQQEKVKIWESKNTQQYKKAIITWTNKDIIKRNTAKENNLKWLEFFNMDEFIKWYKT